MTEENDDNQIHYEVLEGEIRDGLTYVTSVRVEVRDVSEVFTFSEEVQEDTLTDAILDMAIEELATDLDFDYTEAQRFRKKGNNAKALVQMFHLDPCTTTQFTDVWEGDYASSYPSKLRDKGLVTSVGKIGSKSIWTLTPEGVKEALCLIGHPDAEAELKGIRKPEERSGLEQLFPDNGE